MTLTRMVEGFGGRKVLVVGDSGLDRYIHGVCARLCPEAPVPIFTPTHSECRAGLAGNVAANLAALGAQVKLCSIIGDDQDGVDFQDLLDRSWVLEVERCLAKVDRKTTVKSRYVSDSHLLLRVDEEITGPFDQDLIERFNAGVIEEAKKWADIVVVQDYAKGVVTEELIRELGHWAYIRDKELVVDPSPKRAPSMYYGATYLKPNVKELDEIKKKLNLTDDLDVCDRLRLKGLLVTLGGRGMIAYAQKDHAVINTVRKEVHSVCGAGDTVTAVLALGLVSGLSFVDSARLANAAAGVVVGKFGTATLSKEELIGALHD